MTTNPESIVLCTAYNSQTIIDNISKSLILEGNTITRKPIHIRNSEITDADYKTRIDNADAIYIINLDTNITKAENTLIEYARSKNKHIYFYNDPDQLSFEDIKS